MRTLRLAFRAAIVLLLGALALLLWERFHGGPGAPTPGAVVTQIQRLNQLTTVRYTIQKVVGLREAKLPVGEESILLILQARVEAGINLESLRPGDVTVRGKRSVAVRLPAPEILSIGVDEKETQVWDRQKTWWTPWVPYNNDLEKQARVKGLETVRKAALDMGILEESRRNAESAIRGLLTLAGIESVTFIPPGAS